MSVAAVDGGRWLDKAGLLKDSAMRPGKPRATRCGGEDRGAAAGDERTLVHRPGTNGGVFVRSIVVLLVVVVVVVVVAVHGLVGK
jgi:hypothetical protein